MQTRKERWVHSQGFEPWTHWLRVSCSTNWAKSADAQRLLPCLRVQNYRLFLKPPSICLNFFEKKCVNHLQARWCVGATTYLVLSKGRQVKYWECWRKGASARFSKSLQGYTHRWNQPIDKLYCHSGSFSQPTGKPRATLSIRCEKGNVAPLHHQLSPDLLFWVAVLTLGV